MLILQFSLLLTVALSGFISVRKDYSSPQWLQVKKRKWGIELSRKQFLAVTLTTLIGVSLVIQIISMIVESYEKTELLENQNNVNNTLISNFRTTIKKADVTLNATKNIFDSLNKVHNNVVTELNLQRNLNEATNSLLVQNQTITKEQRNLYGSVDRLINPMFPMTFSVFISIPFDDKLVTSLKKFACILKEKNKRTNKNYHNIHFSNTILLNNPIESDTIICAEIDHPDSVLKSAALFDFWNATNYDMSFIKGKVELNFNLCTQFKCWKSLDSF